MRETLKQQLEAYGAAWPEEQDVVTRFLALLASRQDCATRACTDPLEAPTHYVLEPEPSKLRRHLHFSRPLTSSKSKQRRGRETQTQPPGRSNEI